MWQNGTNCMTDFTELYKKLDYTYEDESLLNQALTHSSYVNDYGMKKTDSNERLEFLGDAVLGATVANRLYSKYPDMNEGALTKLRAKIVCEQSLSDVAKSLNLGDYLNLSKGEISDNGREKPSILSDAMEAVIGSMYLDGGHEAVAKFIVRILGPTLKAAEEGTYMVDSKSKLQKILQKKGSVTIEYIVREEIGVPHDKIFVIDVNCDGVRLGTGRGKNKKAAEMAAAKNAMSNLE